jgi:hypothetical protein
LQPLCQTREHRPWRNHRHRLRRDNCCVYASKPKSSSAQLAKQQAALRKNRNENNRSVVLVKRPSRHCDGACDALESQRKNACLRFDKLGAGDRFEHVVLQQLEGRLDERVVRLATTRLLDSSCRRNGGCCGCDVSTTRESGFRSWRASG